MTTTLERLESAHQIMVKIVAGREDGRSFLPIVLHLEKQIAAHRGSDDDYLRILELATRKAA